MSAKPDAKICNIREQIIEDPATGLIFQFEVMPDGETRFRVYGEALPFGNREFIFDRRGEEAGALADAVLPLRIPADSPEGKLFRHLANEWIQSVQTASSAARMAKHHAYQRIISMGQAAVPYLLLELQRRPDHWFIALHEITGQDPVRKAHRGNIAKMARDWIAWGKEQGHI